MTKSPEQVAKFIETMRLAREGRAGQENVKWFGSTVERAVAGTASPRDAIKAFCIVCVGEVKSEITNCTARKCPLYRYRPFQP